jgi:hypothetical protein
MKFVKRPVVIEAFKITDAFWDDENHEHPEWAQNAADSGVLAYVDGETVVRTLEDGKLGQAKHAASPDDWLIRGVKGELYFCKPDIFEMTYEPFSPDNRAQDNV